MEGCYRYFDLNNNEFICSGKAVGQNFGTRHTQHEKASKLTTSDSQKSRFYNSYPSKTVKLADNSSRKGEFENLQMLVGMGFDKLLKGKLMNDFTSERGIFHFDSETKKNIDRVNFRGNLRLQQKQLQMLGYLWELAYPSANISGNPGFESVLECF